MYLVKVVSDIFYSLCYVGYGNLSMCVTFAALFAYDKVIFCQGFCPILYCLNTQPI